MNANAHMNFKLNGAWQITNKVCRLTAQKINAVNSALIDVCILARNDIESHDHIIGPRIYKHHSHCNFSL
jgi:hypothetical protein